MFEREAVNHGSWSVWMSASFSAREGAARIEWPRSMVGGSAAGRVKPSH